MTEIDNSLYEQIIKKIKHNRISTTEIADCLGKKGALTKVSPVNKGHFRVGKIFFAYAYNDSNWELHEQLQNANEDDVVIVEAFNCNESAVFGDLVSKYLLLYKGVTAIVINGYMRDTHRLIKENYPIWCKGVTPIGCHNTKNEKELDPNILDSWRKKYVGSIAVCDDGGTVIIPPEYINKDFLEKLDFIELQEEWSSSNRTSQ